MWACLISSVYLPTLATRFDFSEDGDLVYSPRAATVSQDLHRYWERVAADFRERGPFRPVVRLHLQAQAELLGPHAFRWHLARVLWSALATGALLWLLIELGIRPGAAALTAALAMWAPYRSSLWINLALAEGAAMPYALLGMVCAVRAARSRRAWGWDLAGALCVLAALGCKNTFAVLVPAQVVLRVTAGGQPLRDGWRRHGSRACLLALTLMVPIVHYTLFTLQWHPGQYATGAPSWVQLGRMLGAVARATNVVFVGPSLALAVVAVLADGFKAAGPTLLEGGLRPIPSLRGARVEINRLWGRYRAALLAGLALLVFGIGVYLPVVMDEVYERYAMPAVWGVDLWTAVLLSTLAEAGASLWRRCAWAALACALGGMAIANLGIQDRFAAHNAMLWQALEFIEQHAPPSASIGWVAGAGLPLEEGIHFAWHLQARGRGDLTVQLFDPQGRPVPRSELPRPEKPPALVLSGTATLPLGGHWGVRREFNASFWARTRRARSYLWAPGGRASAKGDPWRGARSPALGEGAGESA